jgi:hypothetical protein
MTEMALETDSKKDSVNKDKKQGIRVRDKSNTPEQQQVLDFAPRPRTKTRVGSVSITDKDAVYVLNPESKTQMGVFIKKVTPSYAQKLLDSNHVDQRNLKEYVVESYLRAMKSGLWSAGTGESVKFSAEKGELIDGQHRLTAVVRSKVTVYMLFMTGILEDNIKCIDNGASRNLGDVLRVTGNTKYRVNTNSLAAFIRHFHYQRTTSVDNISESTVRSKYRLCSVQAINLFHKMPNLDSSLARFTHLFGNKITKRIPQSVSMLMFYLFEPINHDVTFSILKTLEGGVPFDSKRGVESPAWAICQWITERKMQGVRFETMHYINAFIWAFDMMMNGKTSVSYNAKTIYTLGKEHAGCDQISELFEKIKY